MYVCCVSDGVIVFVSVSDGEIVQCKLRCDSVVLVNGVSDGVIV